MIFNLKDLIALAAGINPHVNVHMVLGGIIALGLAERMDKKALQDEYLKVLEKLALSSGNGDDEVAEALLNEWSRKVEIVFNSVR
jgi:hypothetical protein